MDSHPPITCDTVQRLTSGISCLVQGNLTAGYGEPDPWAPYCNQFLDTCRSKCNGDVPSSNETMWKECMLYSLQLHNIRMLDDDWSEVYLVDSPSPIDLGPPWNDTGLATCLTELCHQSPSTCTIVGQSKCSTQNLLPNRGLLSISAAQDCRNMMCSGGSVNTDVFGIGVYISYMLQLSLIVLFVISWAIFRGTAAILDRKVSDGSEKACSLPGTQNPQGFVRMYITISELALSFHKSQCVCLL